MLPFASALAVIIQYTSTAKVAEIVWFPDILVKI
jgi:hypothetical protein